MLSGCYIHTVDEKNRISLPARLRAEMPGTLILTKGPDGCLWALAEQDWNALVSRSSGSVAMQRFFVASACQCNPSDRGRMLLPEALRRHAGIRPGDEVAIVGMRTRIEIWNARKWDAASSEITGEGIRQELSGLFEAH